MKLSNESYFSLNFIARKRLNKEGELPISLRITMNGQRAEIYVNRSVKPEDWCAAKGQSKGKSKRDMELNRYLDIELATPRRVTQNDRHTEIGIMTIEWSNTTVHDRLLQEIILKKPVL